MLWDNQHWDSPHFITSKKRWIEVEDGQVKCPIASCQRKFRLKKDMREHLINKHSV